MHEDIVFKGVNGELQLVLNESADFADVLEQLKTKLASAADFFNSYTIIKLPPTLTFEQQEKMAGLLIEHGLSCTVPSSRQIEESAVLPERENYEIKALVVNKTLRGGQKVVYDGSVVVIGDVNAGAEVVAGADIIILGSCRGVAHAGAYGNQAATITANKLVATQIRIAGLIARSPDDLDKPAYMETARIKNRTVIIEPANR